MSGLHIPRTRFTIALASIAVTFLASASLQAQGVAKPAVLTDANGYKYLTPYIDPSLKPLDASKERSKVSTAEQLIRRILSGEAPLATNRPQFEFYYARMYLPNFTQTNDAALRELPNERQRLLRNHLEACTVPAVHKNLVELVLAQMKDIVLDHYHPACRYNAMFTISSLNSVDAVRVGADKKTPEPLIDALPFILEQFTKADNNDAIRMAALLGLVRHLEWDNFRGPVDAPTPAILPQTRDEIVKQLLTLALTTEPPAGRDAAGHEWFRRRAIEGLAHANYNQVDPAVAEAFEKLLKDAAESLAIRCAAATAIGQVVYRAPAKLEPVATAKELGFLALVACDKELTRIASLNKEELERMQRLGGVSGGLGGGYSGGDAAGLSGPGGYSGGPGGIRGGGMAGSADGGGMPGGGMPGGRGGRSGPGGRSGMSGYPGGSGSGRSGYPGGSGSADMYGGEEAYGGLVPQDPKQYRFDLVRRRLRAQLYAVEIGLGGPDVNTPKAAVKPMDPAAAPTGLQRGVEALARGTPEEKPVNEISTLVGDLVKAVETTNTDMASLEKELRKKMKPLEGKTRKLAAPAPLDIPTDVPTAPGPVGGKPPSGTAPAAAPGSAAPDAPTAPRASGPPKAPAPMPPAADEPAAPAPVPAPSAPPTPAPGAPAAPGRPAG